MDKGGEGVQNPEIFADVIYEWSLGEVGLRGAEDAHVDAEARVAQPRCGDQYCQELALLR